MTRLTIVAVDRDRPDADAIARAAHILRSGGVVALPTETLYGFAADPWNAAAVSRIVRIKGRSEAKGMPVLVADLDAARAMANRFSDVATRLAAAYWPGPLTMILEAKPGLSRDVAPDGVALRWSSCAAATRLARETGGAITATSANRSGDTAPALDPRAIAAEFADEIDLLLDAGPLPPSLASTLVDARYDPPRTLRDGPVKISTKQA
jgi:L-threonylcarbamoyladenylate synthase